MVEVDVVSDHQHSRHELSLHPSISNGEHMDFQQLIDVFVRKLAAEHNRELEELRTEIQQLRVHGCLPAERQLEDANLPASINSVEEASYLTTWKDAAAAPHLVSPTSPDKTNTTSGLESRDHQDTPEVGYSGNVHASSDPCFHSWEAGIVDLFHQLNTSASGGITVEELQHLCGELGLPQSHAHILLNTADVIGDGRIDRDEWRQFVRTVSTGKGSHVASRFIQMLAQRQTKNGGHIFLHPPKLTARWLLRHDSLMRLCWDLMMMILLFYIALSLPFSLGFGRTERGEVIYNQVIDSFFIVDILLNFRTTYVDNKGEHRTDGVHIARHYLRTWFCLDVISSAPWELISQGWLPDLNAAKLLKSGKIAKVMKMFRLAKLRKILKDSDLMDLIEENLAKRKIQSCFKVTQLVCITCVTCHWLACFMVFCGGGRQVDEYLGIETASTAQRYIVAVYWAVTTVTTVGYGDVTPITDIERMYVSVSMIIGGCYYGYIIGNITSIISTLDLNTQSYFERMDLVQSWLDFHMELPRVLRRRVRRHFKDYLFKETAIEDSVILNDLSPELREECALFIIHEEVRFNPLFTNISNNILAQLVNILHHNKCEKGSTIVTAGDPGLAMYIIIEGLARYEGPRQNIAAEAGNFSEIGEEVGSKLGVNATKPVSASSKLTVSKTLSVGDSFGEEIILKLEECYNCSVLCISPVELIYITQDNFFECFGHMQHVMQQMRSNFNSRGSPRQVQKLPPVRSKSRRGLELKGLRSSLIDGGSNGIPADFPDAIGKEFEKVRREMTTVLSKIKCQ